MLERTDAVTNEVLEPITIVLAYLTVDTEKTVEHNKNYLSVVTEGN
jgi:hypothetical protein